MAWRFLSKHPEEKAPKRAPSPEVPAPRWLAPPTETGPKARFLDCPDFPADKPLGFPHLIDTWNFSSETDLRSFRLCDAVITMFYKFNRSLCLRFCDPAIHHLTFTVTDKRVHDSGVRTWSFDKAEDTVRVEFIPVRYRTIGYAADLLWTNEWIPTDVKNVDDPDYRLLENDDMELYGSYIGRRLMLAQLCFPTAYFEYNITVNGGHVHQDWPGEDRGSIWRTAALGLSFPPEKAKAKLGAARDYAAARGPYMTVVNAPSFNGFNNQGYKLR